MNAMKRDIRACHGTGEKPSMIESSPKRQRRGKHRNPPKGSFEINGSGLAGLEGASFQGVTASNGLDGENGDGDDGEEDDREGDVMAPSVFTILKDGKQAGRMIKKTPTRQRLTSGGREVIVCQDDPDHDTSHSNIVAPNQRNGNSPTVVDGVECWCVDCVHDGEGDKQLDLMVFAPLGCLLDPSSLSNNSKGSRGLKPAGWPRYIPFNFDTYHDGVAHIEEHTDTAKRFFNVAPQPAKDSDHPEDPHRFRHPSGQEALAGLRSAGGPPRASGGASDLDCEAPEGSEGACGSSSGYESDLGETTDEDEPSSPTAAQLRLGSNSNAGVRVPDNYPGFRQCPPLGAWIADPTRPFAFYNRIRSQATIIVIPASEPSRPVRDLPRADIGVGTAATAGCATEYASALQSYLDGTGDLPGKGIETEDIILQYRYLSPEVDRVSQPPLEFSPCFLERDAAPPSSMTDEELFSDFLDYDAFNAGDNSVFVGADEGDSTGESVINEDDIFRQGISEDSDQQEGMSTDNPSAAESRASTVIPLSIEDLSPGYPSFSLSESRQSTPQPSPDFGFIRDDRVRKPRNRKSAMTHSTPSRTRESSEDSGSESWMMSSSVSSRKPKSSEDFSGERRVMSSPLRSKRRK